MSVPRSTSAARARTWLAALVRRAVRAVPPPIRHAAPMGLRRRARALASGAPRRSSTAARREGARGLAATGDGATHYPPTDLLLLIGLTPQQREACVRELVALSDAARTFRPVFITDATDFTVFRRHGAAFDHIPSRAEWDARFDPQAWPAYASRRMQTLAAHHQPRQVLAISADDPRLSLDLLTPLLLRSERREPTRSAG